MVQQHHFLLYIFDEVIKYSRVVTVLIHGVDEGVAEHLLGGIRATPELVSYVVSQITTFEVIQSRAIIEISGDHDIDLTISGKQSVEIFADPHGFSRYPPPSLDGLLDELLPLTLIFLHFFSLVHIL